MTFAKDRGDTPLELKLREFDRWLGAKLAAKQEDLTKLKGRQDSEHLVEIVDHELYQLEAVRNEFESLVGPWL